MDPAVLHPLSTNNRVLEILLHFSALEAGQRVNHPAGRLNDANAINNREQRLQNILLRYKKDRELKPNERATIKYIRHELRKINVKKQGSALQRFFYRRRINNSINWLRGRRGNLAVHEEMVSGIESKTAVDHNAAKLMDKLKEAGIKGHIEVPLKNVLAHDLPAFSIPYYDVQQRDTGFTLFFRKIEDTDAYYVEKMEATHAHNIQLKGKAFVSDNAISVDMTKPGHLSAEQAHQLAAGRAVEKIVNGENVWLIHDPKQPEHVKEIRFDLGTALKALPIKEQEAADLKAMIRTLAQGRPYEVSSVGPYPDGQKAHITLESNKTKDGLELQLRTTEGADMIPQKSTQDLSRSRQVYQAIQKSRSRAFHQKASKILFG